MNYLEKFKSFRKHPILICSYMAKLSIAMQEFSEDQIDNIHKILYVLRQEMPYKHIFYFRRPGGFKFRPGYDPEYFLAGNDERNTPTNSTYLKGFFELYNNLGGINLEAGTVIVPADRDTLLKKAPSLNNVKDITYCYLFTPIYVRHKVVACLVSAISKKELESITIDMLDSLAAFFDMISSIFVMQELSLNVENQLIYKNRFEQLIAKMSTDYAACPNNRINNVINDSLSELCNFTSADYGFIYVNDENNKTISRTNSWSNGSIIYDIVKRNINEDPWKHIMGHLIQNGMIVNPEKFDDMPGSVKCGKNVRSIIIIPIMCVSENTHNRLKGFVGLASKHENKFFNNEDLIEKLKIVGVLLTSAIKRRYLNEAKNEAKKHLNNQLVNWKKQTHERQKNLEELRSQLVANRTLLISNTPNPTAYNVQTL